MGLSTGERLGAYQILGPLGAGGMGEVYRARDSRLGREVAVKVLPRAWASHPERLRRFEQEGRAASALAHPNILTVHDLGEQDGLPYLVTELLDGETLRQRMTGGALAPRKAIEIAAQIASGLAAAHERGIVHRDLKPENVFLTADGRVKILDFGIARVIGDAAGGSGSGSGPLPPTIDLGPGSDSTTPLPGVLTPASGGTAPGVVLGTLGYMAPEQVRGQEVGPAADLFALGALLYEMLAGRPAFSRATAADTVAAVLAEDPPELPATVRALPPALMPLVRRCLEKRPEERYRSARDLAFALSSLTTSTSPRALPLAAPSGGARRALAIGFGVVGAVAALAVAFVAGRAAGGGPGAALGQFRQLTDLPGIEHFPSISPDGATVAFDSGAGGEIDIYIQRFGGAKPIPLTAGDGARDRMPAFAPDGARIAFQSDRDGGGLFVMGATGESIRRLTAAGFHPAWTPDGREIVFSTGAVLGPQTVPVSELRAVEVATGRERALFSGPSAVQPQVSPSGRRVAFWFSVAGRRDLATVPVSGNHGADDLVRLTDDVATDWAPVWSPDGRWIFFASDRSGAHHLWRIPVDEASGRPRGPAEPLPGAGASIGPFALARDGRTLVYRAWIDKFDLERIAFDPVGGEAVGEPERILRSSWLANPDPSPDGRWLVANSWRAPVDLWLISTDGGEPRQLTSDPERDARPMFSPDGATIAFHSARGGKYEIWTVRPDGSALEALTRSDDELYHARWSSDGRRLAASGERGSYLIDPSTRPASLEPLVVEGAAPDEVFVPWSWSPDDRRIAGYLIGPGEDLDDRGIALLDLASHRLQRVTRSGWNPWLLPDGRRLLYLDRIVHGDLRLRDLATGEDRRVLESPAETPLEVFTPSRGFDRLYLSRWLGEGDLWSATLDVP